MTRRRLAGLDRSGPEPVETRAGQPLRPLTIPNLVGYVRLAAIPVFVVVALGTDDGVDWTSALIFWLIAVGDLVDGFLARATGQYSRMGALLDPVVDRLTVLAGVVVCWHFELLPRWAIVVLGVREVATPLLGQMALRRGIDLEITWIGRIATFLVFSSIFWTMVIDTVVLDVLFVVGTMLAVAATLIYVRSGLQRSTSG